MRCPTRRPAAERIRLALRGHLGVVSGQLDVSTVFVREWRYLTGERLDRFVAERRRYEERIRELYADGLERSELRADLDVAAAALLFLSAANWAYTWLRARRRHRRARRPLRRGPPRRHARVRGRCESSATLLTPGVTTFDEGSRPAQTRPQRCAYARGSAAGGTDRQSVLDEGDR